jgi:hypothetical protein
VRIDNIQSLSVTDPTGLAFSCSGPARRAEVAGSCRSRTPQAAVVDGCKTFRRRLFPISMARSFHDPTSLFVPFFP